ncbi:translocation/assembly module TamB domain-containing protein [Sulfurovum riftiae]|uniref:Translocation and assembly module TamB C-terminal domain-containing protein n=1 Tax=Sulfurovum riftiae TaxID=1630136 RepID=A0A151CJH6_9BACT|nr:translocation/assembly module TamB domain-containing protein [Sulfurovum riftiae]KYJ87584.1 hypothetical protein AS592_10810 [Sulfurovum riftiae]
MKKFFYGILIFFVSLLVIIVIAANSSYVIKKAADAFAPDYNITYDDITGNVFTGVKINGLKYADMNISKQIKFSWNPSKILYKRIAISEISGENIDVDSVKALIASFPASEDNSSSEPFPLVVTVGEVHVSVNPFVEQGILFEKTRLDAEDIFYASDEVEVGDLQLQVDTNVTDLKLHAALEDGKVTVKALSIEQIDSETLQAMFMPQEGNAAQGTEPKTASEEKSGPINSLIPKEVEVEHFTATLKPRAYLDASVDRLKVTIDDVKADIVKIIENKKSAISVGNYALDLKSDVGQVDIEGMLKDDTVTLKKVNIVKVDTMALKSMFAPDSNETDTTEAGEEVAQTETNEENNSTVAEKKNNLIPQKIVLRSLHADVLPATFKPIHILAFALDANGLKVDLEKLLVEEGEIDLNGTTNLTNFSEKGKIRNNQLKGHIVLTPNQTLFDLYELPLRKEAIGDIRIDFGASKEKVRVDLNAKAKHILIVKQDVNQTDANATDLNESKQFNVDIDHLKAHLVYLIGEKKADANADIQVTTPYAEGITLKSTFTMADSAMQYEGALKIGQIEGFDPKLVKPVNNLQVVFKGNEKELETKIDSDGLAGYFNVPDFKKSGKFHLETKAAVEVGKMVTLPPELNATKVNAVIDVPLNFAKLVPIKGKAVIRSNVANVDADLLYGDTVTLKVVTKIPKDSLLKNFDKNIRWNAISPLTANVKMGEKEITASLKSSKIAADMKMLPFAGTVDGKIKVSGVTATIKGDKSGTIRLKSDVSSFKTLLGTVNQFYRVDNLPKVEGKLDLSVVLQKSGDIALNLTSPQVIYHADRKTVHNIDDVKVSIGTQKGNKLLLKSYQLTYNKMKFFATKPSEITFKDQTITIAQLWLNDQLKVTGQLDTKTMKGEILADAPTFHFAHEMIDLDSRINIKTKFNGAATDVNGKVTLLGGDVHYDLGTKSFPSDSDILIVQEMKKKEPSPFMDNLTINMIIDSEKPLVYKQGDIDMQANADMKILKAINSDPLVLGELKLVKGGTYDFQGKRFVVKKGDIYFTGDPSKPLLDVEVEYQAENYLITITVSGTPAVPVINFSSRPSLTREQILSVILFDSEEGAGSNSSEDMMKMMGGAMAKSALANAGVKIDYLSLGTDGSMEIGKKITDKITVIYVNDEVSSVRMKYRHSPRTESILEFDEISQSYDIVYRRDMSADDIIMLGRDKE